MTVLQLTDSDPLVKRTDLKPSEINEKTLLLQWPLDQGQIKVTLLEGENNNYLLPAHFEANGKIPTNFACAGLGPIKQLVHSF